MFLAFYWVDLNYFKISFSISFYRFSSFLSVFIILLCNSFSSLRSSAICSLETAYPQTAPLAAANAASLRRRMNAQVQNRRRQSTQQRQRNSPPFRRRPAKSRQRKALLDSLAPQPVTLPIPGCASSHLGVDTCEPGSRMLAGRRCAKCRLTRPDGEGWQRQVWEDQTVWSLLLPVWLGALASNRFSVDVDGNKLQNTVARHADKQFKIILTPQRVWSPAERSETVGFVDLNNSR